MIEWVELVKEGFKVNAVVGSAEEAALREEGYTEPETETETETETTEGE